MDLDLSHPVRWAIIYRALTVGALVAGVAVVAFGFIAGFRTALLLLFADPLNPGPAIEQANPSITLLFCLLGIVVWQFGKAYALFFTLPRASGRAAARKLGSKGRSRVTLKNLDERLASMEAEIAETRREIQALERGETTAAFDERDLLESDSRPARSSDETRRDTSTGDARDRSTSEPVSTPRSSGVASGRSRADDVERDERE
ncbi:hypothetical protein [Natronorubrum texcoconense]|uniref:Uncharacterized protein n=1 Tax=Natronorubrum texcoconense TaxID=1095776 RepID=A0A1G8X297_9EURY|nr:hypothetical protein [Natronorubrum texcoconense]SDJ83955.1 hypothetical protein SAMN04515672_1571 [Natronorubrum texcoconense]